MFDSALTGLNERLSYFDARTPAQMTGRNSGAELKNWVGVNILPRIVSFGRVMDVGLVEMVNFNSVVPACQHFPAVV